MASQSLWPEAGPEAEEELLIVCEAWILLPQGPGTSLSPLIGHALCKFLGQTHGIRLSSRKRNK